MEVTQKIAQYISDSSDEEVQTDNNDMQRNKKTKKRQTRYWVKEAEFSPHTLILTLIYPENATVQLFLKITYASTSLEWLSD